MDQEKIGAAGWSNGAILTLALITRNPARYKAAVSGAGGFEWLADLSFSYIGHAFSHFYFGKLPWEDPELYRQVAPYYEADRITSPLLILHGDADTIVPVHHGWMQFRALQQRTKTPVRFVVLPEEEHALKKLSSMRRKIEEELAWLEQHLFGIAPSARPWLKEGSPMAALLARRGARSDGTRLGVMSGGILAPETTEFQGLRIGRFEVTRAQFAAFDRSYPVPPGQENFPATGVSFEQAKAYCAWLTAETGSRWRLPTSTEAKRLYQPMDRVENTLDYWAGYPPNSEDAKQLVESAKAAGTGALLREVGSFGGAGNGTVFDLGGNAAEWISLPNHEGRPTGGSADQPKDGYGRECQAGPEYVGFRVIRE